MKLTKENRIRCPNCKEYYMEVISTNSDGTTWLCPKCYWIKKGQASRQAEIIEIVEKVRKEVTKEHGQANVYIDMFSELMVQQILEEK